MNLCSLAYKRLVHLYRLVLIRCHILNAAAMACPLPVRMPARSRALRTPEGFDGLESLDSRVHLALSASISGVSANISSDGNSDVIFVRTNALNELEFSSDGSNYTNDLDSVTPGIQAFAITTGRNVNVLGNGGDDTLVFANSSLRDRMISVSATLNFDGGTSVAGDSIIPPTVATSWTITGPNSGRLEARVLFSNVEIIKSGGGSDQFTFDGTDQLSMRIIDNGGTTTLTAANGSAFINRDLFVRGDLTVSARDRIVVSSSARVSTRYAPDTDRVNGLNTFNSGNMVFVGDSITLEPNSLLTATGGNGFTGGDINIKAADKFTSPFPTIGINAERSEVLVRGTILGENVYITSDAADIVTTGAIGRIFNNDRDNTPNDGQDDRESFSIVELLGEGASVALATVLPIFVMRKRSESLIQLDSTAVIRSAGTIAITASSVSDGTLEINPPFLSIGYAYASSDARVNLKSGSQIYAKHVTVASDATSIAEIDAETNTDLGAAGPVAVSLAISSTNTISKVTMESGANIYATGSANIDANAAVTGNGSGATGSFQNGKAGVALGMRFATSDVSADVAGSVTGFASDQLPELVFTPSEVNFTDNTIRSDRHGLRTGQPLEYKKPGNSDALGGLKDQETYYVIRTSDPNRFKLAASAADAYANIAVDLTTTNVSDVHTLELALTNGVGIRSSLAAEDSAAASAGFGGGGSSAGQDLLYGDFDVADFIGLLSGPFQSAAAADNRSNANSSFGLAGALAFMNVSHVVTTTIRPTAVIVSKADAEITSSLEEKYQLTAEATADSDPAAPSNTTASAAVSVGKLNNTARTEIQANARIDAKDSTTISSEVAYPFINPPKQILSNFDFITKSSSLGEFRTGLGAILDGKLGIQSTLFNTWSHSSAKAQNFGISGSVNYVQFNNTSETLVRSGAKINTQEIPGPDQKVDIAAKTTMQMVHMTGIFTLDLSPGALQALVTGGDRWALLGPMGGPASRGGAGGSVFIQKLNNTTTARIENGASISTAQAQALTVAAKEDIQNIILVQSGGRAQKFGVAGSFSLTDNVSNVTAKIDSGVTINAGSLNVLAESAFNQIQAIGSTQSGGNAGVGVSIGIDDTVRNTSAILGNDSGVAPGRSQITTYDGLNVFAQSTGTLSVFSVAAAVTSTPTPSGPGQTPDTPPPQQDTDPLDGESLPNLFGDGSPASAGSGSSTVGDKGKQGQSGIAISGDVSIHEVTDNVTALINDAGTIRGAYDFNLTTIPTQIFSVSASNLTNIVAASGSVAMSTNANGSTGLAGSVGIITLNGRTLASVTGGAVVEGPAGNIELRVSSQRGGMIASGTAGGSGATSQNGIAVSGSVSLLTINNTTESLILGGTIKGASRVAISSLDRSSIIGVAGSFSYGGRAGVGAAIALNTIASTTRSRIDGTSLTQAKLDLTAFNTSEILAVTGSAAAGRSLGLAGTVAINKINNVTESNVINVQQQARFATFAKNTNLTASDQSKIASISGAVGASTNVGLGAALSYNKISNIARSTISGTTLLADDGVTMAASNTSEIQTIAAGGAGSQSAALAGAVAVDQITNTTEVKIDGNTSITSTASTPKSLTMRASDASTIKSLAGAVSGGGRASIGASVAANLIGNNTTAAIQRANVNLPGWTVQVEASERSDIDAITAAGAGAGSFAAGGGVSVNTIGNTTQARVADTANVVGGNVAVNALNRATIDALSGGVAGAGTAAIGAAVGVNTIRDVTRAQVDAATVRATSQDVTITADSTAQVNAITAAAAAAGTAAISGSISTTTLQVTTEALVSGGGAVSALDTALVQASDDLSVSTLAGNVAGAGSGAIGASVSTVSTNNRTAALVTGSSITADGNSSTGTGLGDGATAYSGNKNSSGTRETRTVKGVGIMATSFETAVNTAAGAVIGGTAGMAGSVSVVSLNETTLAKTDDTSTVNRPPAGQTTNGWDVLVFASDRTDVLGVAGAVAGGGAAGIGAGADAAKITKLTEAQIGGDARSLRNITVQAVASETTTSVSAAGSGAGTAAIAGAANVHVHDITTRATIKDSDPLGGGVANVRAFGSVLVTAEHQGTLDVVSGGAAIGGAVGIGASASVPIITNTTEASIAQGATVVGQGLTFSSTPNPGVTANNGTFTRSAVSGGSDRSVPVYPGATTTVNRPEIVAPNLSRNGDLTSAQRANGSVSYTPNTTTMTGVAVTANNRNDIEALNVAGAGAGTGAVSISGQVLVLNTTTNALIGNGARVNQDGLNVGGLLIAAGNAVYALDVSGAGSVAGVAAASPAVNLIVLNNATKAYIDSNALVNSGSIVTIRANNQNDVFSVAAGLSGAGTVAAAGSLTLLRLNNTTDASIRTLGKLTASPTSSVLINAEDRLYTTAVNGSGALGITGGGLAASVTANLITKNTVAYVDTGAEVVGALTLRADSSENLFAVNIAGSGGFIGGISGSINFSSIDSTTTATIFERARINAGTTGSVGNVSVIATNDVTSRVIQGTIAGGAFGGLAGSIDIGLVNNPIAARIAPGASVRANALAVRALGTRDIDSAGASVGGGAVGLSGTIAVYSLGAPLDQTALGSLSSAAGSTGGFIDNDVVGKASRDLTTVLNAFTTTDRNGSDPAPDGPSLFGSTAGSARASQSTSTVANSSAQLQSSAVRPGITATIADTANITYTSNVTVEANNRVRLSASVGALAGGGLAIGGSLAILSSSAEVSASIGGTFSGPNNAGVILVSAILDQSISSTAIAGSGGSLALGAQYVRISDTAPVIASVRTGTSFLSGYGLTVSSDAKRAASARSIGGAIGGVAAGLSLANATVSGATKSEIPSGVNFNANLLGPVRILANSNAVANAESYAVAAGALSGTGADSNAVVSTPVDAILGANTRIDGNRSTNGDLEIYASSSSAANAVSIGRSIAAIGSLGISRAVATNVPIVTASLGGGSTINAASVIIGASQNVASDGSLLFDKSANAFASAGAGGLVGGLGGAIANAANEPRIKAEIGASADINATWTFTIGAQSTNLATARAQGDGVGFLGVGAAVATANANASTIATVAANTTLDSSGAFVAIIARSYDAANADSIAAGGGLIALAENASSATVNPVTKVETGLNADITAQTYIRLQTANEVHAVANTQGLAAGVAASVGTSKSVARATPTVTTAVGSRSDLIATKGQVFIETLANVLFGNPTNIVVSDAAVATSTASVIGLLFANAKATDTQVISNIRATTTIGDFSRIAAGQDVPAGQNLGYIRISADAGNDTRMVVNATAGGLFTRAGTDATNTTTTAANVVIGSGARIQAKDKVTARTNAQSSAAATVTGGGGATLGDFLRSLLSGNITDAFNNLPSIISTGGSIARLIVDNDAKTAVGDSSQIVGADIELASVAGATVNGRSSMESRGSFRADATSVTVADVDSDAVVDTGANTALSARTIVLNAENIVGGSVVAQATTNVTFLDAAATGITRFNIGTDGNRAEALVNVGTGTNLAADTSITQSAKTRQVDSNVKLNSEARARASGGLAGTAKTLASGTANVGSRVVQSVGSVAVSPVHTITARSTVEMDRKPISAADTAVSRFVEQTRRVVRSVTKWLPWPLSAIVEAVVSFVTEVVEVFDFSNATGTQGGSGVVKNDVFQQSGTMTNQAPANRRLVIDPVSGPIRMGYRGPDDQSNIGYLVTPQGIIVDNVENEGRLSVFVDVPFGQVFGDGEVVVNSVIDRIDIVNNSGQALVLQDLQMIRNDPDPQIRVSSVGGDLRVNKDVVHSSLFITDNSGADVILTQSIDNVAADITIIATGNILAVDPSIFIRGGDVGLMRLQAGGNIGSASAPLNLKPVHGQLMPDGTPAMMQSRISIRAGGAVYVDMEGANAVYTQATDYQFEADSILVDVIAGDEIYFNVVSTVILDDSNDSWAAQGLYEFTKMRSLRGDVFVQIAAGDAIISDISTPGLATVITERSIFQGAGEYGILADTALLIAGHAIGRASEPMNLTVNTLGVGAARGEVSVINHGDVTLAELGGFVNFTSGTDMFVTAEGSITVETNIEAGGLITMTALEAAGVDNSITVNDSLFISAVGTVSMNAGDNVDLGNAAVTTSGNLAIVADAGDADPGEGVTVTAAGALTANDITIHTGADNDTINVALAATNAFTMTLASGDGNDTITGSTLADIIDAGNGIDTVNANGGGDIILNAERTDALLAGRIDTETRVDVFHFNLTAGQRYALNALVTDGDLVPALRVLDTNGNTLAQGGASLIFQPAATQSFLVEVSRTSGLGAYQLTAALAPAPVGTRDTGPVNMIDRTLPVAIATLPTPALWTGQAGLTTDLQARRTVVAPNRLVVAKPTPNVSDASSDGASKAKSEFFFLLLDDAASLN